MHCVWLTRPVASLHVPSGQGSGAAEPTGQKVPRGHVTHWLTLDIAPTTREFGWRPTPLAAAFDEYHAWLDAHPALQARWPGHTAPPSHVTMAFIQA